MSDKKKYKNICNRCGDKFRTAIKSKDICPKCAKKIK